MRLARSCFALVLGLAAIGAVASFTACAADDEGAAPAEAPPDAQTLPQGDAGGDARNDACADGPCTTALDCSVVDFCSTPFPVSRLVALNAVWGSGPSDVWAVGTRGTILHGNGSSFVPVATGSSGSTDIYVAVWGSGPSDVWILGPQYPLHGGGFAAAATVLEPRPGATWNPASSATGRLWSGVSAGARVWLAGEESARFGMPRSSFWSYPSETEVDGGGGGAWSGAPACPADQPCSPAIRSIWSADAKTLWAVGRDGEAFVLDAPGDAGSAPRWLGQNSNTRNDLESVWGSGPSDVWAVGRRGTIRHTSKGSATWAVTSSPTTKDLHAVWGSGPSDVWAAGDDGTILHYDGKVWALASLGLPDGDVPTNLFGVWGSGPDDVWIVGEGLLLHRTAISRRHP